MKKIIYILHVFIFVCMGMQAQTLYYIRGYVYDANSNSPLNNAKVALKNADNNSVLNNTKTNSDGQFIFSVKTTYAFIAEASMDGYTTKSTAKFYFGEFQESVTLDKIYLQKNGSPVVIDPVHIDTLPPEKVIEKRFNALDILPTAGAYELFFALNPELKSKKQIPDNYEIKYPKFPSFSESRQIFNQRFKKDKRKGEPFISKKVFSDPGVDFVQSGIEKKLFFNFNIYGSVSGFQETNEFMQYNNQKLLLYPDGINGYFSQYDKPKKFVFVMWKYAMDGKPVTDGVDVRNRYLVKYYTGRNRDDTLAHNKSSNATYGYAPMLDAKYFIEVYDQETGKRVRVSDNEIDPHSYFERKDIWVAFNIAYSKILIRVYD